MKNQSIDLTKYATQVEAVEATKQFLLGHGFTIVQYDHRYFDFQKHNKWGHFTVDSMGAFSLSSSYKPSRAHGTGCQVADHTWEFSLDMFENALNNTVHCRGDRPAFYRDLDDRVASHWAKDKDTFQVTYPIDQESDSDRLGFDNGSQ
jgi:hypothetical protein